MCVLFNVCVSLKGLGEETPTWELFGASRRMALDHFEKAQHLEHQARSTWDREKSAELHQKAIEYSFSLHVY